MRRVALCRGVVEWEALYRVRADGVRVRWGAFCVPGCLCAWLSAYLMSTLLRGGLLRSGLVCLGDGVKNLFFVHLWEYLWHSNFALFISQ